MAEKKTTTKKAVKKPDVAAPAVEKPAVASVMPEVKEVKTPVFPIAQDLSDDIKEDEISLEIAKTIKETAGKADRYIEAIGRRKTAVARVRLFTKGDKEFIVNSKPYQQYFQTIEDQESAVASMKKMKCLDKFRITVKVQGGGHRAQAEAIRHGTARVLVDFNANFRKRLRKAGFLTRDPRMRERKKFGLKRARKSPQWAKR
jgi:small subunit ribosomal protein S9